MNFGERLKQARSAKNLTQEIVAQELHVSRQTISSWENERSYPDINSLIQLSNYYQLSLDILLKEDNGMVDEMKRKEELAKINKIWGISYIMNLLFLLAIVLGQFIKNGLFEMGTGVKIIFLFVTMLNVALLIYVTTEKKKLANSPNLVCWFTPKRMKIVFLIEGLILLAGFTLLYLRYEVAEYVIGLSVGILSSTLAIVLVTRYLLKNKNN